MRFGIKTSPQDTTWDDLLDVWRAADDIDTFESAWNFDHFYPIFSDSTGPCMEAWVTLTALAQATTRIRVGTMVNGMVYRHPAVLANMAASLDIVSGGRLELGLGAGWNEEECAAYGIELGSVKDRMDRFDEGVQVIISLLEHETTDFAGRFFTLTGARNEPKGPQRPHPPICIGGSGEKRTLRTTAQYADHWNDVIPVVDDLKHKLDVLDGHCQAVGRDRSEILISGQVHWDPAAEEPGAFAERLATLGEAGMELAIAYLPPPHRADVLEPLAEAVAPLRS
jgi:F420-dependent oxidoreductase-like protein